MRAIDSTLLIVDLLLAIPVAAVAIARLWSPDLLAALILIPAWCWLIPGVITIAVAKRRGRKNLLTALALFWFLFALGAVEETRSFLNLASGPRDNLIRVVSLNCANTPRCVSDLQGADPDIVLLQEAPGDAHVAEIARALFGETASYLCGGDTAILARGSIEPRHVERAGHFVAGTVTHPTGHVIDCISLRLSPPPPHVEFWSSHFWASHRDCRVEHRRQLEVVAVMANQMRQVAARRPFVLGGDFNTTPGDRALATLRPVFRDAFLTSGVGIGGTGTNEWPLFRVDLIWTTGARPVRTWAAKTTWSDHRMVVCEILVGP